jgi:predicted RNA-binding Zn ribbon-like protein
VEFLCLEYVNSSWYITHKLLSDPLRNSEWLIKLAEKWLHIILPAPTEAELAGLIEIRSCFARLLTKIVREKDLDKADIELLNSYMGDVSFSRQLKAEKEGYRLYDIPITQDWSWFMVEAAASLARLYSSEAAGSLKTCQNPECGWFFIDESKSRNRKWCDDTCATLMKVRRFREKQKASDK